MLERLKGTVHVLRGPVNIGGIVSGNRVLLIDSGNDSDKAKKLLKTLEGEGLELEAVWNTHSHADHWGGNHLLQDRTGCEIRASKIEAAIINNNIMEPFYLYGAMPLRQLRNKFLMAKPCVCGELGMGPASFRGQQVDVLDLKGHSPGMIGFLTEERIAFIGDALIGEEIVKKYKMLFTTDVKSHFESLTTLKETDADWFVPGHGEPVDREGLEALVECNREALQRVNDLLLEACRVPRSLEELLGHVAERLSLPMNVGQYFLNRSTLSAHLAYLCNEKWMEVFMEGPRLLYENRV